LTEPFRLVMIEAMACGMPVLAFRSGSVPEIVEDGLTERIVSSSDEAIQAIPELLALDRKAIRARFEERFSSQRMASDYVNFTIRSYASALHRKFICLPVRLIRRTPGVPIAASPAEAH
jgi:glycosyltransferase involved in cell wall biosynthesis